MGEFTGHRIGRGASMNPKVSLILPVYNTSKHLVACLESVVSQSYTNIEVICVNDESTDNSQAILERYASIDSRISIVTHSRNRGLPASRNTGVLHATGEYIRHVDSDDVLPLNSTQDLLEIATRYGSEIVIGNADRISGTKIFEGDWLKRYMAPKYRIRLQDDIGLWRSFGDVWLYLFKKDYIDKNQLRFHDEIQFGEDQIFVSAALAKASNISYCNEIVYLYRDHSNSMSSTYPVSKIQDEMAWPKLVKENISRFPQVYIYNLLSSSVNRFKILEYGIRNCDRDVALGFIAKAQSIYEEISVEGFYSQEAALAYPLLDKHTLHLIILLKTASPYFIYSFIYSERFKSLPDDKKRDNCLGDSKFQRLVSRIFSS
jgi:glycosyltransferase involved in cell wall biosynthesis